VESHKHKIIYNHLVQNYLHAILALREAFCPKEG
jgi:hypothetical protein